uniref:Carboxylesterase type B domain-containing protein n=1 Tax=Neolamprologus brichardi TaxID=32507 RepID=A0A3Q4GH27_NEOBR
MLWKPTFNMCSYLNYQLLSPLSEGLFHHAIAESGTAAMDLLVENYSLLKVRVYYPCCYSGGYAFIKSLIIAEYIGNGADRVKNRDGFSEVTADILFNIPVIKTANAHREAGAPVYLYEYQHSLKMVQKRRPSFVGSDHTDEIFTVLGFFFGVFWGWSEELSRTMMSYWGNFARTGSPNGHNLVHWPKYEADEKYLAIDLKTQVTAQHLKKERFVFLTQTVPEKLKQHDKNAERSEL